MMKMLGVVLLFLHLSYSYGLDPVWPCDNTTLGIQDGRIKDSEMKASSSLSDGPAYKARLNGTGAWLAAFNDLNQYLQIDLLELYHVNGVFMQGNPNADEWVKTYEILFSVVGKTFVHYRRGLTLKGNSDRNSIVAQLVMYPRPHIIGRYIRIVPLSWHNRIAMRIELAGCNKDPGIRLNCTKDGMILQVPKRILFPLRPEQARLLNPNCTAVEIDIDGVPYYEFDTGLNECKTICYTTPNFIHYYNMVSNPRPNGVVIFRNKRVRIPFSCTYKSTKVLTSVGLEPNLNVTTYGEHSFGFFTVTLTLFNSDKYDQELRPEPPLTPGGKPAASVELGLRIYAEIEFAAGDRNLVVKAKDCWASPDSDPHSAPRYMLIQNGVKVEPTLMWHPMTPKSRKRQRFSFKSFVLLKHHRYVFIHCTVIVCKLFTGFCRPRPGKRGMLQGHWTSPMERKERERLIAQEEEENIKYKKEMGVDKVRGEFEDDHQAELISQGPIYLHGKNKLLEEQIKLKHFMASAGEMEIKF